MRTYPVRLTLPVTEWPVGDLQLWKAAQTPAGPFRDNSPAVAWSSARRHIVEDAYGQWLQWLLSHGLLDPAARPGMRATPERVLDYVVHLDGRISEVSVGMMVGALVRMLAVLDPKADWAWLRAGYQYLKVNAKPSRNKRAAWVPIKDLYDLGIRIMCESMQVRARVDYTATQYRDGLIVSFLAALPIRIKNFSTIELGKQLVWRNGAYWLVLTEDETKNGRPYEAPVPDHLAPYLEHYLKHVRKLQLEAREQSSPTRRLWVNRWGEPMDSSAIRFQIKDRTRRAFGHKVWPHLFRDCVVTSIAIEAPDHLRSASVLVGHSTEATTLRYYNLARTLEAGRMHQRRVREVRREARERTPDVERERSQWINDSNVMSAIEWNVLQNSR